MTDDKTDLEQAIDAYDRALANMQCLRDRGAFELPGMIAHTRLKLLALRREDGLDSRRQDQEGHRNAILKIVERPDDDLASVSYLHWAQAIALADMDDTDGARAIMDTQLMADVQLASTCAGSDVLSMKNREGVLPDGVLRCDPEASAANAGPSGVCDPRRANFAESRYMKYGTRGPLVGVERAYGRAARDLR